MRAYFTRTNLQECVTTIVHAAIDVYIRISTELLPIPVKSHYMFNLRDLSDVFHGICSFEEKMISSQNQMVRLWWHECQRVFVDRLNDVADCKYADRLLKEISLQRYSKPHGEIFSEIEGSQPVFCDFIDPMVPPDDRMIDEITSIKEVRKVFEAFLPSMVWPLREHALLSPSLCADWEQHMHLIF
jgi:dynein heavy chain, axonemal